MLTMKEASASDCEYIFDVHALCCRILAQTYILRIGIKHTHYKVLTYKKLKSVLHEVR